MSNSKDETPSRDVECVCPKCGGNLYRGSHNGTSAYKCMSANHCEWSKSPIGRTKREVKRVVLHL